MRRIPLAVGLAALALVAGGCLKGKIEMTVERDGTASMLIEMAIDPRFAEFGSAFSEENGEGGGEVTPEQMRDEMRDEMETDLDDLPEGAKAEFEDITIDDWPGLRVSLTGVAVDDLMEVAGEDVAPGDFIGRDGDGWRVSISTSDMTAMGDMSTEGSDGTGSDTTESDEFSEGMEEMTDAFAEMMFGDATITWRVTMPGRVIEHEGGEVSGSTVTWKIKLTDPPERIAARWDGKSSPGGGGNLVLYAGIGAVVLAAAAGVVLWQRRRSASVGETPDGGPGGAGDMEAPPPAAPPPAAPPPAAPPTPA